jgi:hypothetical protein
MSMIDVYATEGTFTDKHRLAQDLANAVTLWVQVSDLALFRDTATQDLAQTVMSGEQLPDLAIARDNTAAFIHDLPAEAISNAAGASNYVRVQVLTPVGVLDRVKQLGVVKELTDIIASAGADTTLTGRTWVLLTESNEGGEGINGPANTDITTAARTEVAWD